MKHVREHDIKVWVRVATYGSDIDVKHLAELLANHMNLFVRDNPNFIVESNPTVEVYCDTRT